MFSVNYVKPSSLLSEIALNQETPFGVWYIQVIRESLGRCEAGFAPKQGPRSLNGDRDCSHINIKGELTAPSSCYGPGFVAGGVTFPGYPAVPGVRPQPTLVAKDGYSVSIASVLVSEQWYNSWYWIRDYVENFKLDITVSDTLVAVSCNWTLHSTSALGYNASWSYVTYRRFTLQSPLPAESNSPVAVPFQSVIKMKNTSETSSSGTLWFNPVGAAGATSYDSDQIMSMIWPKLGPEVAYAPGLPDSLKSGVELDAVEACKVVKINTLALAVDIKNIHTVANWARNLTKWKSLRDVASSYLGYKYGAPLTASDVTKLVGSISQVGRKKSWKGKSIARSRGVWNQPSCGPGSLSWKVEYNVKLYYTPVDRAWATVYRGLADYGLAPTAKNLWDFIPYSFTLDWVINASDYLATQDARDYLSTIDLHGVVRSVRQSITLPGSFFGNFGGELTVVVYNRWVAATLALSDPSLSISNPSNHLLEGGALIAVRSKF